MAAVMIAGRYELLNVLGRGAMGQVWRARDTQFDRLVAVKIVKLIASTPKDLRRSIARFEREVFAIRSLNHRNIAAAYDAGRDGEQLYLVTELVSGQSVDALLRGRMVDGSGPLPIPAALEIGEQVCAGLTVAHAAGIVHRDLKPANLMLSDGAEVKIIDFGIVMLQQANLSRLTLPGTAVGSLAYAAPEQLEGGAIDGRTDLYALGCVLYEVIAGVRPFAADRAEVLLHQRMAGDIEWLHEKRPDTPVVVARFVAELLRPNPSDRPASADVVRTRIRELLAMPRISKAGTADAKAAEPATTAAVPETTAAVPGALGVLPGHERPTSVIPDSHRATARPRQPDASPHLAPEPRKTIPAGHSGPPPYHLDPQPAPGNAYPGNGQPWWKNRWILIASAVVLVLVVAAAAIAAFWNPAGGSSGTPSLAVTSVVVTVPHACGATIDIVGTINTNGHAGTVDYTWTRSDTNTQTTGTLHLPEGQNSANVHLLWTPRGIGSLSGTATLNVTSPPGKSGTAAVRFPCH